MQIDAHFIIQIITIFLGGSATQFLVRLLNRRALIRNLGQTGDATLLSSANTYVGNLQEQITKLDARLVDQQKDSEEDKRTWSDQLTRAHEENVRLSSKVASLQTDLDIARGQISQMNEQIRRMI